MKFPIALFFFIFASEATTTDYSNIYCDHFPQPSDVDEGNYGDAVCYLDGVYEERLLVREILSTDGQSTLNKTWSFPLIKVTRVNLLNFGRFHGATKAIGILNGDDSLGQVEILVEIFSRKGIRMIAEIYGSEL